MYELRILPKVSDVPRETWDALVGPDASPFVEWTWLDCLEEAGCVGGETAWTPLHFTLYRDQKLIAAAPAYAKATAFRPVKKTGVRRKLMFRLMFHKGRTRQF